MKKIILQLILIFSAFNFKAQISDKWDTIYKVVNVNPPEIRKLKTFLNNGPVILMGNDSTEVTNMNYKSQIVRFNPANNTVSSNGYSKISTDFGLNSTAQITDPGNPNIVYTYYAPSMSAFLQSSITALYKHNSQTNAVTTQTFTYANPDYYKGILNVVAYSSNSNVHDTLTYFVENPPGPLKLVKQRFNQTTPAYSKPTNLSNVISFGKSIVFQNKLFIALRESSNGHRLYSSTIDAATYTLNPLTSIAGLNLAREITEMDTCNGYLYIGVYDSDGFYDIYSTNDGVNFNTIVAGEYGQVIDMIKYKNKIWYVYRNSGSFPMYDRPSVRTITGPTQTLIPLSIDTIGRLNNQGQSFRLSVTNNSLILAGDYENNGAMAYGTFIYKLKTPTANFAPLTPTVLCINKTYTFTNTSVNADSVRWIRNNNFYASVSNTFVTSFNSLGQPTIGLIAITGNQKDTLKLVVDISDVVVTISPSVTPVCQNAPFVLSQNIATSHPPTTSMYYQITPNYSLVGSGTSYTSSGISNGSYIYSITVTNTVGCVGTATTAFIVLPSTNLFANVTSTAGAVSGSVTLFRYESQFTKFDSIDTKPIITGVATFTGAISATYIMMANPTNSNMQTTYSPNSTSWFGAIPMNHGCANTSTQNIQVQSLSNFGAGTGMLTGKITEGIGFGQRIAGPLETVPGGPVKGVSIKMGRNPGGEVGAAERTNSSGQYTFNNVPNSGPNEKYFLVVDIPGLDTNGTYYRIINSGNQTFTDLDFVVDSAKINAVGVVGIKTNVKEITKLSVYPNPFTDKVSIAFNTTEEIKLTVVITDIMGRKLSMPIREQTINTDKYNSTIDLNSLDSGIYFVNLIINNQSITTKVIKQ